MQPATFGELLIACFAEAGAFGVGTLVAIRGPVLSAPVLGVGLFIIFFVRSVPGWNSVATFTAVCFAFGIGLPGASVPVASLRASFLLVGRLWGLFGFGLDRILLRRKDRGYPAVIARPMSTTERLRNALLLAIACSLGYAIGFALGFPRDYWIIATIIFTVRLSINLTRTFTVLMSIGTVLAPCSRPQSTSLWGTTSTSYC